MSIRRTAISFLIAFAVATGGWLALDPVQRLLIFRPAAGEAQGFRPGISEHEDVWVPVGTNGDRIHAWWAPARRVAAPERAPVLFYLHGARWNLTGSVSRIASFQDMGFNVFAIDYRGFGKSTMRLPSETSAREDALAAWEWLRSRVKEPRRRIIYGHSLGGAIGTDVALRGGDAGALVLEGVFTSAKDMARRISVVGHLPLDWLVTQDFDTLKKIREVAVPLFIVHGNVDTIVPADMARQLFAEARPPKRLLLANGFGHLRPVRGVAEELRRELFAIACPDGDAPGRC